MKRPAPPLMIEAWQSCDFVAIHRITEMKDGCVMTTKFVGYCWSDRLKESSEVYVSLNMKPGDTLKLEPWFS